MLRFSPVNVPSFWQESRLNRSRTAELIVKSLIIIELEFNSDFRISPIIDSSAELDYAADNLLAIVFC